MHTRTAFDRYAKVLKNGYFLPPYVHTYRKTTVFYPMIRTRRSAYQEVRHLPKDLVEELKG